MFDGVFTIASCIFQALDINFVSYLLLFLCQQIPMKEAGAQVVALVPLVLVSNQAGEKCGLSEVTLDPYMTWPTRTTAHTYSVYLRTRIWGCGQWPMASVWLSILAITTLYSVLHVLPTHFTWPLVHMTSRPASGTWSICTHYECLLDIRPQCLLCSFTQTVATLLQGPGITVFDCGSWLMQTARAFYCTTPRPLPLWHFHRMASKSITTGHLGA